MNQMQAGIGARAESMIVNRATAGHRGRPGKYSRP